MLAWHAWNLGYHPLYLEEALNSGTENVEAGGSETQVILSYIPSLKLAWVTWDSILFLKKWKNFIISKLPQVMKSCWHIFKKLNCFFMISIIWKLEPISSLIFARLSDWVLRPVLQSKSLIFLGDMDQINNAWDQQTQGHGNTEKQTELKTKLVILSGACELM